MIIKLCIKAYSYIFYVRYLGDRKFSFGCYSYLHGMLVTGGTNKQNNESVLVSFITSHCVLHLSSSC